MAGNDASRASRLHPMLQSAYLRFQSQLVHPEPQRQRRAILALLLLCGLGVGLVVALGGPFVAIALFLAALGGWLVVRSPLWGLIGIVAISTVLPFATLPFKIGFTPTFLDIAIFATFVVWAWRYVTGEETRLESSAIGVVVALFLAIAVVTFVIGIQNSQPSMNNLRQFMEMVVSVTLFFVVINIVRDRRTLTLLAQALMIGGAAAGFFGVAFYLLPQAITVSVLDGLGRLGYPGGYGALRFVNDDPAGLMRAIGTSIDPNVLGGLTILVGLFTLPQLFTPRPILPRRWVALILALDVACLYLTISRGSMLGFALGACVIGALRYRKLLVIALVAGILLFLLPFTQTYIQHLLAGFAGQDRATQMRFGEYRDALTLISRYPYFGVGFTGTPEIGLYIGVSSLYLLMAEEMGLIGLVIFLVVMALFLLLLLQNERRTSDPLFTPILTGILGSMIGLLAAGLLDHYLFNLTYPHMTALLWVFVGLGMATVRLSREQV